MNTSINDICKVLLTIEMSHNHFNKGGGEIFVEARVLTLTVLVLVPQ